VKIKKTKSKPRILLYDLETSPNLAYVWGKYEQDVIAFKSESEILSVAWKWLGEKTRVLTRADFRDKTDRSLCQALWKLLDEADIVIAHNGLSFDNKVSNARFAAHSFPPVSDYISIDTCRIAKQHFRFNSSKLDDLGQHLKLGRKVKTGGFSLWLACLAGDKDAFKKMARYNKGDVNLLEKIYMKFRPWITNHPNLALMSDRPEACPRCASESFKSHGIRYTRTRAYRRFRCNNCGGQFRSQKSVSGSKVTL